MKAVLDEPSRPVVLVVEDDPMLRINAASIVEEAGFVVVEARDAERAMEILIARADIQIVFADLDVPGSVTGLEFAIAIRGRWPPIDLLLTSSRNFVEQSRLPERAIFLSKPYRVEAVTTVLHDFMRKRD